MMWARQAQRILAASNSMASSSRSRAGVPLRGLTVRAAAQPIGTSPQQNRRLNQNCLLQDLRFVARPSRRSFRNSSIVCMGRRSSKIAVRKGKSDQQRAKLYGKIGKQIAQAARTGGTSPLENSRLKELMDIARAAQVPRDVVDRNLKRATDAKSADFSEAVYECYGAGATGFVVEALTDNLNRAAAEVRSAINKGNGKIADAGSVLFNFKRMGVISVAARRNDGSSVTEDEVLEGAMDAGAEDMQQLHQDDSGTPSFKVSTAAEDFMSVWRNLEAAGLPVTDGTLQYVPLAAMEVSDANFEANEKLFEALLALEDVDNVYTTCEGLH